MLFKKYFLENIAFILSSLSKSDLLFSISGKTSGLCGLNVVTYGIKLLSRLVSFRLLARGSIAPPPLGNFADKPYLKEQLKLSRIRDVCTLSVGALSCNSLLHMLPKQN